MKILQVVHNFLPNIVGGAEIYTYGLSKELIKRNDVYVFYADHNEFDEESLKMGNYNGLPFISVNPSIKTRWFFQLSPIGYFTGANKKVDSAFRIALEKFKPDIIHFQHLFNLSTNLVNIAFQSRVPMVFTVHDYWFLCPRVHFLDNHLNICKIKFSNFKCVKCLENRLPLFGGKKIKIKNSKTYIELPKNLIKTALNSFIYLSLFYYLLCSRPRAVQKIIEKIDLFITPSLLSHDRLSKFGIPKSKLSHSELGVFNTANIAEKTKSANLRFAFIGSITQHKGIGGLIDAFNGINNATLDIYGNLDRSESKQYQSLINNKNIRIKGGFQHENIGEVFHNIDVLIVPSVCMENFPLTVREAFANKTPVIASDIGGLPEMIQDGKTGLLFEAGNQDQLTEKIRYLINNPSEISRMREEIGHVKTIEENAFEIESIYKSLLHKKFN